MSAAGTAAAWRFSHGEAMAVATLDWFVCLLSSEQDQLHAISSIDRGSTRRAGVFRKLLTKSVASAAAKSPLQRTEGCCGKGTCGLTAARKPTFRAAVTSISKSYDDRLLAR
jgi:hypothetical protein